MTTSDRSRHSAAHSDSQGGAPGVHRRRVGHLRTIVHHRWWAVAVFALALPMVALTLLTTPVSSRQRAC